MNALLLKLLIIQALPSEILASIKTSIPDLLIVALEDVTKYRFCAYSILETNPLSSKNLNTCYSLYYSPDWNACNLSYPPNTTVANNIVLVKYGFCALMTQIENVKKLDGSGLILVMDHIVAFKKLRRLSSLKTQIPVTVISEKDGGILADIATKFNVLVSIDTPKTNYSYVLLVLMTISVIAIGSFCAAKYQQNRPVPETEPFLLEICGMICWITIMSIGITLMYFFYRYLVYLVIIFYSFSCTSALNWIGIHFITLIPYGKCKCFRIKIRKRVIEPEVRRTMWTLFCIAFVIIYLIYRNNRLAWLVQDILGISLSVYAMIEIMFPQLQIPALINIFLIVYDVFFVFITPFLTKDGESIMVYVATGDHGKEPERIPMLFLVPHFGSDPYLKCIENQYALIGVADIIIPGFIVSHAATYDLKYHGKYIYFTVSLIAYICGLLLTIGARYLMNSSQPALLYLVPCTLIPLLVAARIRGEMGDLWFGKQLKKTEGKAKVAPSPRKITLSPSRHSSKEDLQ